MNRNLWSTLSLILILPIVAMAEDKPAVKLAEEIVTKGAALFDTRDAAAMAATYTENARLTWYGRDESTSEVTANAKEGRALIEGEYRDMFKDKNEKTTSRNIVESAAFVTPEILMIQGTFQPDVANAGKYPFIQIRVKKGEKWLVKDMQIFVISRD